MTQRAVSAGSPRRRAGRAGRGWTILLALLLVILVLLGVAGEMLARRAGPILRQRLIEALSTRFHSHVELDALNVSLFHGLEVSGRGLRIGAPLASTEATSQAARPMVTVAQFSFHTSLRSLFERPLRIGTVHVSGLDIRIPPHGFHTEPEEDAQRQRAAQTQVVVDRMSIRDSRLLLENSNPAKLPKIFDLHSIDLEGVAQDAPVRFSATLVNAVPRGDVHVDGSFGPWASASPGTTPLDGHYTFEHADLGTIHGLSGTLRSSGEFRGQLHRLEVNGSTETPDFALETARQPMSLRTTFHAIVDGTTGDTLLQPVQGRLRNSAFTCRGLIVNEKGKGHIIDLTVEVPNGFVQDFLALAVKTRPVLLSAQMTTSAQLHLRPGRESLMQRLATHARFSLRQIHLANPAFQQKIDQLSLRAQGLPAQAALAASQPGPATVSSAMNGQLELSNGHMTFDTLNYTVPGAEIQMQGVYSLDGDQFDFHGKVRTQAQASGMVQSWWKQILLHAVDKYLSRNGAGVEIPFTIHGTRSVPQFGLDFDQFLRDRQAAGAIAPTAPTRK